MRADIDSAFMQSRGQKQARIDECKKSIDKIFAREAEWQRSASISCNEPIVELRGIERDLQGLKEQAKKITKDMMDVEKETKEVELATRPHIFFCPSPKTLVKIAPFSLPGSRVTKVQRASQRTARAHSSLTI